MTDAIEIELPDETATLDLGALLAGQAMSGGILGGLIFLHGELGAGKTTLVRGFLRALGHDGVVKSPTYTLIEPYELDERQIYHLDIYRLADATDLDDLGVRDLLRADNTVLVEWPERAQGALGQADTEIFLAHRGDTRKARLLSRHAQIMESLAQSLTDR